MLLALEDDKPNPAQAWLCPCIHAVYGKFAASAEVQMIAGIFKSTGS